MYEITLKYQSWFYSSRLHRPDLFTALGAVLDSHKHTAIQWYQVRPLTSEQGAPAPPEKAEAPAPLVVVTCNRKPANLQSAPFSTRIIEPIII